VSSWETKHLIFLISIQRKIKKKKKGTKNKLKIYRVEDNFYFLIKKLFFLFKKILNYTPIFFLISSICVVMEYPKTYASPLGKFK
jgi:hypothetical protein